jgi:hypothetical protein
LHGQTEFHALSDATWLTSSGPFFYGFDVLRRPLILLMVLGG